MASKATAPLVVAHRALFAIPVLVALVLAAPGFFLPFLWDDFDFLGRAQDLRADELVPDPETLYYRPISREIYFSLLHLLGTSPFWGHAINAAALAGTISLLFFLVRSLAGQRAALFASLIFAVMGANPVLVGWVCGSQDVLAMLFTMGAILAQLRARTWLAVTLYICALLSKETAAAMLPAILVASHLGLRRRRTAVVAYILVSATWLLIHPAPRLLASGPSRDEALHSVRTVGPLASLAREFLAIWNIPLGAGSADVLTSLAPYITVAGALLVLGLSLGTRMAQPPMSGTARRGTVVLGLAIAVPSCLMAGLLPLVWSPYYSCMPALGLSVIAGAFLARARPILASVAIATYFALGLWSRTVGLEPIVTSESHLRSTGAALVKVERGFKALRSSLPEDAHAYVSAQVQGPDGVYLHLYRFQPLRVWYGGPSIFVLDPNRPQKGGGRDYLFWITRDYNVFEVDLHTYVPRGSGAAPDLFAYQKTLRTFALGRASVGNTDEAVRILLQMPDRPPEVQAYDRRTAAALLLAADRRGDAGNLLGGMAPFTRESALDATFAILHEPIPGLDLDDAVMEAFGLSPSDREANRMLMQAFDQNGFSEPAIRFARRVAALSPNDPEPRAVLQKWSSRKAPIRISVPIPHS